MQPKGMLYMPALGGLTLRLPTERLSGQERYHLSAIAPARSRPSEHIAESAGSPSFANIAMNRKLFLRPTAER